MTAKDFSVDFTQALMQRFFEGEIVVAETIYAKVPIAVFVNNEGITPISRAVDLCEDSAPLSPLHKVFVCAHVDED
jgi:hypothetical protein